MFFFSILGYCFEFFLVIFFKTIIGAKRNSTFIADISNFIISQPINTIEMFFDRFWIMSIFINGIYSTGTFKAWIFFWRITIGMNRGIDRRDLGLGFRRKSIIYIDIHNDLIYSFADKIHWKEYKSWVITFGIYEG